MINVCNIFRPISNETGNFLLFSQYTNDLTQSTTDSSRRVRPSRFVCLNLDPTKFGASNLKTEIPKYFQNVFENGISLLRNLDDNNVVDDSVFSTSFWVSFISKIFTADVTSNIVYDGRIGLSSYKDGFADILLDIPSGSKKKYYQFNEDEWDSQPTTVENFQGPFVSQTCHQGNYISGWSASDNIPINGSLTAGNVDVWKGWEEVKPESSDFDSIFQEEIEVQGADNSFLFNTIVILYDIVDSNNQTIASDIPMGVFFTGTVENNSITNPVTIYESEQTAYGVGSGWSLRICTRFAPTPQGYLKIEEVAVESSALTQSISALLAANAETIKTINESSQRIWVNSQGIRDTLNIFKDGRTNVPYIKEVNGINYWFVNGRNTGQPA